MITVLKSVMAFLPGLAVHTALAAVCQSASALLTVVPFHRSMPTWIADGLLVHMNHS